ncbi:hypothetical protein HPB51_022883 [Rhipicephalus microplus]|uniref:Ammonium transporter AmtB-like domain-containing protein n=1 Tax=Rhipicephalus microplus TaxID=6941 RepID=A0A9J6DQA9_RHIMP|nr:hypothetical protein HPB51_022883 [Rhipicephalus microplus]
MVFGMEPRIKTAFALGLVEGILLILFGVCVTFDRPVQPRHVTAAEEEYNEATFNRFYPMFEDVHVMVYVGFGYLMTFLRRFGYSAVGNTLLQSAIVLQWAVIMRGIWRYTAPRYGSTWRGASHDKRYYLFAVMTRDSPQGGNRDGRLVKLTSVSFSQAADPGGSIFLHTFGAYFGLSVAFVTHNKEHVGNRNEGSSYIADVFSMIASFANLKHATAVYDHVRTDTAATKRPPEHSGGASFLVRCARRQLWPSLA